MARDKANAPGGNAGNDYEAVITGHLHDNATAHDLLTLPPLMLSFRDLNYLEKIARLSRDVWMEFPTAGLGVGDTGYYGASCGSST